jgi:WD40 repeat protein
MRSLLLPACLLALLPLGAVADEPKDKASGVQPIKVVTLDRKDPVAYEKDVEPVLVKKCFFCHSGNVKEAKFDMSSYEALMKGGRHGKPVVAGKADESLLYHAAGKTKRPFMPPKTEEPLTPEELAILKLWIDQGAKAPTGVREKPKVIVNVPPATVHPVEAIAVSPDKSAVAGSRGNEIHLFDAGSGTYIRTLVDPNLVAPDKKPVKAAHLALVDALAYSPDGKYLASGSFQEVKLWDAKTGALLHTIPGYADRVVALDFSPDGKLLATGGGAPTDEGELKLVEVPSGKLVKDIKNAHSDTIFGVSFSPDGKLLATCGADKFVKVFEVPEGKFVKSFEGHTHHVLGVGWKSDGKLLASAGADNTIKIWNYEQGEQKQTIANAHAKQVTRLVFVGKTPQFVTCSGDQIVKMWNVDNGGNVRTFTGSTDYLFAVGVSPDGSVVAAGGEDGVVRLYNGNNGALVKALLPPGVEPAAAPKK